MLRLIILQRTAHGVCLLLFTDHPMNDYCERNEVNGPLGLRRVPKMAVQCKPQFPLYGRGNSLVRKESVRLLA
jgi:hypothetical protein